MDIKCERNVRGTDIVGERNVQGMQGLTLQTRERNVKCTGEEGIDNILCERNVHGNDITSEWNIQ